MNKECIMYRIWVGKRESDVLTYHFFDCSITFYGSNQNNNFAFCEVERIRSSYDDQFTDFVIEILSQKVSDNPNTEIHFYNNVFAYKIANIKPGLMKHIVNLNSLKTLNMLNHKTLSRLWLNNTVAVPAFSLLSKSECTINNLQKKFGFYHSYVIQKNISGGGSGTYIINNDNETYILDKLSEDELYLASPYYYPNDSLSCHAMIGKDTIIIFPISVQLIYTGNSKMEYAGNNYSNINLSIKEKTKLLAHMVCRRMQKMGYRGICGFDFIHYNNQIFLIEINPRYQGSSYVINLALKEQNCPSLFEINTMCFTGTIADSLVSKINELNVYYESRYFIFDCENDTIAATAICSDPSIIVFDDGFQNCTSFEHGAYLFRYLIPN